MDIIVLDLRCDCFLKYSLYMQAMTLLIIQFGEGGESKTVAF